MNRFAVDDKYLHEPRERSNREHDDGLEVFKGIGSALIGMSVIAVLVFSAGIWAHALAFLFRLGWELL